MTARPARLMAACTTLLLVAGLGTAVPADAKAKAKATKTGVTASRAVAGAKVTLTATVKPKAKVGTVRFTAAGKTVGSCAKVKVRSGKARCTTTFASAGKRSVAAKYSGKAKKYKASTGRRTVAVAAKPAKPAAPAAAGTIVGTTGSCTTSTGALVAVSYGAWQGPIVRGCDTTPTKGNELLSTAGFTIAQVQRQPGFICRLGHPLFNSAAQYPTAAQTNCVNTPPASAYWSSWLAAKGSNTWTYASLGAYSQTASNGQVQAWTFGATDVGGTTGKPTFTPDQVRAGMATAAAQRTAQAQRRAALADPETGDQDAATKYLTSNLIDGTHYEPFGPGVADIGLTIDAAYALAASGTDDSALRKIVGYVADNVNDYTFINDPSGPGDAGRIGKVALLAEMVGRNPRAFGSFDLVAELNKLECANADAATGCTAAGAYPYVSSTFGQTLAVMALLRAGADATEPLTFLRSLQGSSGGFPSDVTGAANPVIEVDSTGMAVMALDLAGVKSPSERGQAWLAGQQSDDGGFPGAAGNSTNSAALAVLGLTLGGSRYADAIGRANTFLAGEQNSDGGFTISAGDGNGSDVRASAQVLSALAGTPFSTVRNDVTAAEPKQPDVAKGARFVVSALTGGSHFESTFGDQTFVDYGGTGDAAIALAASGGQNATLIKIVKYLRDHVAEYVDPSGTAGGPYGGAAGKLATIARITGQNPRAFGGTDLVKVLTDNVCTARDDGDFPACSAAGDFRGAYAGAGQAFGVLGLARAGAAVPAAALTRLLDLQCADGGFSSTLLAPDATDEDCDSEVDTTGFAVQALVLVKTTAARDAVRDAVGFLRDQQKPNGSWDGAVEQSTNSTSLAMQGLLAAPASADFPSAGGIKVQATRADPQVKSGRSFLGTLQNTNGGFGIAPSSTDSDARSTTQAVAAAALSTLSTVSRPVSLAAAPGGGSGSPSSPGTDSSSAGDGSAGGSNDGAAPIADAGGTADTGVPAGQLIGLALALLIGGLLLAFAGRRRDLLAVMTGGRHRR